MQRSSLIKIILRTVLVFFACSAFGDTATVFFDTNSLVHIYNGNPCSVSATTEPAGLSVEIRYEGETNAPSAAGYYEVIASVSESGWTGGATNYLTIDRAPQTVCFTLPASSAATDTVPLSATSTSGQTPSFGVSSGPGVILGNSLFFTNQGTCVVMACVNGNENWRNACTTVTTQVSRAIASVTLTNMTQSYGGTALEPLFDTDPDDLPVEIYYNGSTQAPVNAGPYSVAAVVTDPQWDGSVTGLFTIVKGEQFMFFEHPGICALTNKPELLAGTTQGLPATFTILEGAASIYTSNDSYYVSFSATGRVVISAANPGNENLLPTAATNTFYVYENPVHIQVDDDIAFYDGSNHAVTLVFPDGSGLTSNDVTVTYDGSFTPPTDAGFYETIVLITNPPSLQGGYAGTMTILKSVDEITTFSLPEEVIATQRIELVATSLSQRPCKFYAAPEESVRIDDQTNLVFLSADDAFVCAYVDSNQNWVENEKWISITAVKAQTTVTLTNLLQPYDGTPRTVTGSSAVGSVDITYSGSSQPPSATGTYTVVGIVSDPIYQGSATGTLIVVMEPDISLGTSSNVVTITWPSITDVYYTLQTGGSDLNSWSNLSPHINLPGSGSIMQVECPATSDHGAFRIVITSERIL